MTFATLRETGTRRLGGSCARLLADFVGYGLVSVAALACDYGLLLLLVAFGVNYLLAATAAFSAGMVLAYALSARFVFADRRDASRQAEAAGFFAVGLAGLVATQIVIYILVSKVGLGVAVAKIPTAGLVFLFNFTCRRSLVFRGGRAP